MYADGGITLSPALVEAVANGEVSEPTDFTATPVDVVNLAVFDTGSSDSASSAPSTETAAPTTAAPATSSAAPAATTTPPISPGETAVDTFKTTQGLAGVKNNVRAETVVLVVLASVGSIGVIMMAVMYKRRANNASNDEEHQRRTTTCMFENPDYTPGKPSMDAMLQDDRMTTGSSTMLPVFSMENRMDVSAGIVRLSSPFGARNFRISSPAGLGGATTNVNMEFSVDPNSNRGGSGLSFNARSTPAASSASTDTVVYVKRMP